MTIRKHEESCRHCYGFRLIPGVMLSLDYPAVWRCVAGCGFFLNFDPDKFPDGVAYLTEPSFNQFKETVSITKEGDWNKENGQ